MAEKRTEVRVFRVSLTCDDCGGEMLPTGRCRPMSPPQYQHKCGSCGAETSVSGPPYPRIAYEDIGSEQ